MGDFLVALPEVTLYNKYYSKSYNNKELHMNKDDIYKRMDLTIDQPVLDHAENALGMTDKLGMDEEVAVGMVYCFLQNSSFGTTSGKDNMLLAEEAVNAISSQRGME